MIGTSLSILSLLLLAPVSSFGAPVDADEGLAKRQFGPPGDWPWNAYPWPLGDFWNGYQNIPEAVGSHLVRDWRIGPDVVNFVSLLSACIVHE